ncbi:hypothetical protein LFX25_08735 [Leptospira sp. FAT2]|uniref:hypothetical protein n=1 Tax=Leptospira sanjuanensis TaxID=2879643 RepID=UPI001EE9AC6B|nr:hypothetical protein [Leptospira sanjuanensis]MCG6193325.1 hypothetical protein [Leptospira sanjuanensis]
MNVTGLTIQPFSFSWPQPDERSRTQPVGKRSAELESETLRSEPVTIEKRIPEKDVVGSESIQQKRSGTQKSEVDPEELVMKPSPVSLEERMNQVISPEQMKNLLSMMVRSRMSENATDHKIDVRR